MSALHLFGGYGIEIELMIVDRGDLRVRPICDDLLRAVAGETTNEVAMGPLCWSNELALHVVELKCNGPARDIPGMVAAFADGVRAIDERLASAGAMLLPTAMHPTMDPSRELRLWPHDGRPIYCAYDRIFDCRGHGWANLQSCHLNLPFCGDHEFARLHAAVRAVLPLVPALAASSPLVEGRRTPELDHRLAIYLGNQRRLPSILGAAIPEPVYSEAAYREQVLAPMFAEIAPYDPAGDLQHEWLNSRGAIARFERSAIEIRLLDVQEAPVADLAIAHLVSETIRALCEERWFGLRELQALEVAPLRAVLLECMVDAERTRLTSPELLAALGMSRPCTVGEVWANAFETLLPAPRDASSRAIDGALRTVLERGCLARRIAEAVGEDPSRARIDHVYRELADGLVRGEMFTGAAG